MLSLPSWRWCWALLPLGVFLPATAQNLLTNGNFETGDGTGFSNSALTAGRDTLGQIGSRLSWDVRTDASTAGPSWLPTSDHTPGSGAGAQYMYISRASGTKNATTDVWAETITSTTNTRYTFTGFASIPTTPGSNQSPVFKLVVTGTGFSQTFNFSTPATSWGAFQAGFQYTGSGTSVTYTLSIINGSSNTAGDNTISWDDFTLTAPEPSTYAAGVALVGIVAWQWRAARRRRNTAKRGL